MAAAAKMHVLRARAQREAQCWAIVLSLPSLLPVASVRLGKPEGRKTSLSGGVRQCWWLSPGPEGSSLLRRKAVEKSDMVGRKENGMQASFSHPVSILV